MARKCPTCGGELIQNPKNPAYLLCTNCNKNYKTPSNNGSSNSKKKSKKTKICKHCKTEINAAAKICPNCKKKQGGGILKKLLLIFIVLIAIGAIGSFLSGGDKTQHVDSAKSNDNSNENEKQSNAADNSFNIGEIAEYNDVQVTVLSYEESTGNEWVQPESGKIFVFPEIEITNNSDDEISVSSMISFDCYIGDYKADFSSNAFMALSTESGKQQLDGSIAPGKKIKGVLGIEAPSDWSTIEIYYKDNVWLSSNFSFLISK